MLMSDHCVYTYDLFVWDSCSVWAKFSKYASSYFADEKGNNKNMNKKQTLSNRPTFFLLRIHLASGLLQNAHSIRHIY